MKILYFSNFYLPEAIAPSYRAAENAKLWDDFGNDVVVYTGYPNHPIGHIFDGYNPKLLSKEKIDGVKVIRGKLIAKPSTSIVNRLVNTLSFYGFGLTNIVFNQRRIGKNYDVVLGTSPIIFTALLAKNYAGLLRKPFVFELRDLMHLQLIATGHSEKSKGVKLMKHLELGLCRKADQVVVVTEGFKRILTENGIDSHKISIVTNGVDIKEKTNYRESGKDLVLSYYGTIGISQNISDTFPYADIINDLLKSFIYRIIGDGAQKKEVEENAQKHSYIEMIPSMPLEELEAYYEDTLLSVITLRNDESFRYTIPSKLFQIMGRGIAVLFIGPEGETAEIIRKYDAGIVLSGNRKDNIDLLKHIFSKDNWKQYLMKMGDNGYRAVKDNYSRRVLAKKYADILNSVIQRAE